MAAGFKKPILVGGLGLTAGLWALQNVGDVASQVGGDLLWGAIALGSGYLWLRQYFKPAIPKASAQTLLPVATNRTVVEQAIAAVEALLQHLQTEFSDHTADAAAVLTPFQAQITALREELNRKSLSVAVIGESGVGKSVLATWLNTHWRSPQEMAQGREIQINDTLPVLHPAEMEVDLTALLPTLLPHDLVVYLTSGDLKNSELQILQALHQHRQRMVLAFNKQDHYLPSDRPQVLHQLQQRAKALIAPEDVVAIATVPAPVKVRQHQDDGTIVERMEQPDAAVTTLTQRLSTILSEEAQQLVWSTVLRRSWLLRQDIMAELNRIRGDRALPMIEQSQWIAAAAAFANPVPTLDLLAMAAVNTQLIMDLGALYQQPFSLDQAKELAGTLASQMVKLGLVEVSTQALSPLLKGNALTYVAGGVLQGVSAAYLTRVAGLSLVAYFQERSQHPNLENVPVQLERLGQILKTVFQQNQRPEFLQQLVSQAMARLTPASATPAMAAAGTGAIAPATPAPADVSA
jgi:uncharacterized protein (DUF697 family)/GTP-binding protein EngB required for normal cell division